MHKTLLSALALVASASAQMDLTLSNSTVPSQCSAICSPIVKLTELCKPASNSPSMSTMSMSEGMSMSMTASSAMSSSTMSAMSGMAGMEGMEGMNMKLVSVDASKKMKKMKRADGGIVMMAMSDAEMAQMTCICDNTSFDVKSVMGLCASCVGMAAGSGNKTTVENIDTLMMDCNFPATSYAPSATSILAGINVQATNPAVTGTSMPTSGAMGRAGRMEVVAGIWGLGMIMGGVGLGAGFVVGML